MEEIIEQFLAGNEKSVKLPMAPIDQVIDILERFGYQQDGEIDTNGWQVDFWMKFDSELGKLQFSGSLWYGQFVLARL